MDQSINNKTPEWLGHHFGATKDQLADIAKTEGGTEEEIESRKKELIKIQNRRMSSLRGLVRGGAEPIEGADDYAAVAMTQEQIGKRQTEALKEGEKIGKKGNLYNEQPESTEPEVASDKASNEVGDSKKSQENPLRYFGEGSVSEEEYMKEQEGKRKEVNPHTEQAEPTVDDEELKKAAEELGIDLSQGLKKVDSPTDSPEVSGKEEERIGIPENFLELPKEEQESILSQYNNGSISLTPDSKKKKENGNGNGAGAVAHSSSTSSNDRDKLRIRGVRKANSDDVAEQKRNLLTALNNPMKTGKYQDRIDVLEEVATRRAKSSGATGLGGKEIAVRQALDEIRAEREEDIKREKEIENNFTDERVRQIGIIAIQSKEKKEKGEDFDEVNELTKYLRNEGVDMADRKDMRTRVFESIQKMYDQKAEEIDKQVDDGEQRADRRMYNDFKRGKRSSINENPATEVAPRSESEKPLSVSETEDEKKVELTHEEAQAALEKVLAYMDPSNEKNFKAFLLAFRRGRDVGTAEDRQLAIEEILSRRNDMPEDMREVCDNVISWLGQGGETAEKKEETISPEPEVSEPVAVEKAESLERKPSLRTILMNLEMLQQAKGSLGNNHIKVNQSLSILTDRGLDSKSIAKVRDMLDAIKKKYLGAYWQERVDAIEAEVSLAEKQLSVAVKEKKEKLVKEKKAVSVKEQAAPTEASSTSEVGRAEVSDLSTKVDTIVADLARVEEIRAILRERGEEL